MQLEDAYWNMAAFQENVKVAEEGLATSQQLLDDDRKMAEIGTVAELDVVSAEAQGGIG